MARAIDLDKAIEIIEEKQKELCPVGRYGRNYVYGSDREKYDDWEEIIDALENLPTLVPPNEAEYREYTCPCCSHTWLEDRDALDYPEYCPGCGATLRDGSTPPNEALSPYPDGDTSIIACPHCGSGEYLHNEDGNEQNYCGQCEQAIDWSRPPEGEEEI